MKKRTKGRHARGTNIIPFSMHNVDEALNEVGLNVGPLTRAGQWLFPVDPGSYRRVTAQMIRRTADPVSAIRDGDPMRMDKIRR